jgi:hypothetical protein
VQVKFDNKLDKEGEVNGTCTTRVELFSQENLNHLAPIK